MTKPAQSGDGGLAADLATLRAESGADIASHYENLCSYFCSAATPRRSGAASRASAAISREGNRSAWPTPLEATKRLVGAVVAILNATLLFTPLPLSNVIPAPVIALISLAYLEEDGLLLSIASLAAGIVLAVELVVVGETVLGA